MFPEYVADVERRALQQSVASLMQQVGAAAAVKARRVDSLEREVLHGPQQPQLDVFTRPAAWICTASQHVHAITRQAYHISVNKLAVSRTAAAFCAEDFIGCVTTSSSCSSLDIFIIHKTI